MNLIKQTFKSLSRKEKGASLFFLIIFLFSVFQLFVDESSIKGKVAKDSIYTEGVMGEISRINPVYTEFSEADADISSLVFSGLLKYNAATGEFEEDLATYTLSEDKLTYTFTLKNDVFWHDGEELNAEDVYFTYAEVIQSPDFKNPVLKSNFEGVKIELLNTREVSFTLNSPNRFFASTLTLGILPKHILQDVPVSELDSNEFNRQPIGSGPYKVIAPYEISQDGKSSVDLTLNEMYYGDMPSIKSIRFIAYPSFEELISRRSEWNGAARLHKKQVEALNEENLVSYQYELPQYTALFFNTDAPNLDKKNERLGIAKAIDKMEILDAIDYKVPIDTPLLQLDQEEWIHKFDMQEAQGALFDAGWSLDEESGFRTNEEGERYKLRLLRRDFSGENAKQEETALITAELIKEQLAKIGVEVVIEAYKLKELTELIQKRDYDMLLYGQSLGYNLDVFSYWHSSQATENGLNLSNYQNAKADYQIEAIRTSFDNDDFDEALEDLASIIAEDVPAVFLYTPSYYYLLDTKVTGFSFKKLLRPSDRFSNINEWILN